MFHILVLNLGATSTKVSIYLGQDQIYNKVYRHSEEDIERWPTSREQLLYRRELVEHGLADSGISLNQIDAVAIRPGTVPLAHKSGTYRVNEKMRQDIYLKYEPDKPLEHGARVLLPMVDQLFPDYSVPIFVTNPPNVDEMIPEAKISGHPAFYRDPIFHALNTREIGVRLANLMGKRYQDCNFVMAHMGGGFSLSAHQRGQIVDANNSAWGEGPFSPERSGTLPTGQLVDVCFSGKYTKAEVMTMIKGKGGMRAHLGTADIQEVEARAAAGDEKADLLFRAMAYQTAKQIGAYCAAIDGNIDAIVITGGVAYSERMVSLIKQRVDKLANVVVYPGELEADALVSGALRVLNREEEALVYG